ncbi:hypothetical protein BHE74_00029050 [Ensete ventricosum]|nr:hypothetical protein BHE74_00029050 [Ensete ventricosum]
MIALLSGKALYRVVPSKSVVGGRFRPLVVDFDRGGRLREKEEEGEEEAGEKYLAHAALPRFPRTVRCPRGKIRSCDPSLVGNSSPTGDSFSPCVEKERGNVVPFLFFL